MLKKAAATGEDPFRVLTDDVLEHILSFLPGDDALQTCVLDTQWRDLWRRKTSLCFIFDEWLSFSRERFYQLVKLVIHLRGESPLTDCQINPCLDVGSGSSFTQTELLIEYVLECGVEKLSVLFGFFDDEWLSLRRLVSPHLRILEFGQVHFEGSSLDCCDNRCLLLDGLSNAVALELIAVPKMFIYRWDLKWCPKFDKLKTLVLNDWFTAIDLVCILKHSPILEKLTLKLDSLQGFVGATGSKQSLECAPCLAVSIECRKDDKRVCKILHVLSACGLLSKQISIKHT